MLTQSHRDAAVSSPLGDDAFVFHRMVAEEALSTLFRIELELRTTLPRIDFDDVLGHVMSVRLRAGGADRHFSGIVQSFSHVGGTGRYTTYRAVLRPWLWLLTRNRDCRIFQDRTVPEIVKAVLRDHGFTEIDDRLSEDYRPWTYCVQYQESDFAFVSRLLEHEGIYYYFVHGQDRHTLVLADGLGAHEALAPSNLRFVPDPRHRQHNRSIDEWAVTREVTGGVYSIGDFDFERPSHRLGSTLRMPRAHPLSGMELYEYPGGMANMRAEHRGRMGEVYARQRLEEVRCGYETIEGVTAVRDLSCGSLFTLTHHPHAEQNREYLVLSTCTEMRVDDFEAGTSGGAGDPYNCRFSVLSSREPFRPPRITPVPVMRGPQTAIVSGKAEEKIWTDRFGRIKVHFHWDRDHRADETSSCWIRVAQSWADKRWGAQFLPRIGQEVIVDFLDGDPNRPVVTGCLYNGDRLPPFALPDNATQSGIRTNTVKGIGANELRFEDKAGKERIYLHAQRSQDNRVRGSSRESVGGNRHLTVEGAHSLMVEGDRNDIVWTDRKENADSLLSQMVGLSHHEEVGENYALKAGLDIALAAGVSITLRGSGGFITIDPTGVVISGNVVRINSGGAPGSLTASVVEPDEAHGASDGTPGTGGRGGKGRRKSRLAANRGRIAKIAAQRISREWGAFRETLASDATTGAARCKVGGDAADILSRIAGFTLHKGADAFKFGKDLKEGIEGVNSLYKSGLKYAADLKNRDKSYLRIDHENILGLKGTRYNLDTIKSLKKFANKSAIKDLAGGAAGDSVISLLSEVGEHMEEGKPLASREFAYDASKSVTTAAVTAVTDKVITAQFASYGATAGASLGALAGGVGAPIGFVVGGALGYGAGLVVASQVDEKIEQGIDYVWEKSAPAAGRALDWTESQLQDSGVAVSNAARRFEKWFD